MGKSASAQLLRFLITLVTPSVCLRQVVNVLGFKLPFYSSPTLLLSPAISIRVLFYLWDLRPDVIHVSTPGLMVFAATLYAKMLRIPLVMSYHTHIPGMQSAVAVQFCCHPYSVERQT
jgi:sulfoquinovosyltransferase